MDFTVYGCEVTRIERYGSQWEIHTVDGHVGAGATLEEAIESLECAIVDDERCEG